MTTEKATKILFVNLYLEMGGGEYSLLNLLKGLNRNKYKTVMMFNKQGTFSQKVEALGIETVFIPYQTVELKKLINPKILWKNLKASISIYRYLKFQKVDIIQCSDVLSLILLIPTKILLRIPLFYSIIFYYEWTRMLLFNLLAIFMVKKVITNSISVENHLLDNTMFLMPKVVAVYNGIDINLFHPAGNNKSRFRQELGFTIETKLIGMISRFDVWKGHKTFLKAASMLLEKRKDIKFVIIGGLLNKDEIPSIQYYYREVMDLYKELKLENSVIFLPHRDDIPEIMRSLDILVCPSKDEPFGLVLLEALASGVSVIAADSGGPLEIIKSGKDGFLFSTDSANSLRTAIEKCLDDNLLMSEFKKEGRKKVEEKFNLTQYVNTMERMYQEFLQVNV